jgi:hypothetical protein
VEGKLGSLLYILHALRSAAKHALGERSLDEIVNVAIEDRLRA